MDLIEAALNDLLTAGINWPDHRQEADAFSNECRAELMRRVECGHAIAHQMAMKVWQRLQVLSTEGIGGYPFPACPGIMLDLARLKPQN